MTTISLVVDDQKLYISNAPVVAAGGQNETQIQVTFSSEWDGFGKVACFFKKSEPETLYPVVIDQNGYATLPSGVYDEAGRVCISISGVNDTEKRTSSTAVIKVLSGRYASSSDVDPEPIPEPTLFDEMMTAIGEAQEQQNEFTAEITQQQTATNELATSVSERMDAFVAAHSGTSNGTKITKTTLFASSQSPIADSDSVSAVVFNLSAYDELEITFRNYTGEGKVTVDSSHVGTSSTDTSADSNFLYDPRCHIDSFALLNSGYEDRNTRPILKTSFVFWYDTSTQAIKWTTKYWVWDGTNSNPASSSFTPSTNRIGITKIVGVTYTDAGTDKDSELTDIRVGVNGTTYSSAGLAVRSQLSAIKNAFTDPDSDGNIIIDMSEV